MTLGVILGGVVGFVVLVDTLLRCSLYLFRSNRTDVDDALDREPIVPENPESIRHFADALAQSQFDEADVNRRYQSGSCSANDVLRSRAIRLQAEIAWIRRTSILGRDFNPQRW